MSLRVLLPVLCVTLALAGCGAKEKETGGGGTSPATTQAGGDKPLKDVEPRAAKPNIVGGDAPPEEFVRTAANDAIGYWRSVFEASGIQYGEPTVTFVEGAAVEGCPGAERSRQLFQVCAGPDGNEIAIALGYLKLMRASAGDAGVAFLAGYAVSIDTNDQLSGAPLAAGADALSPRFHQRAVCFTGAWIRNLGERSLLEAGDGEEIARAANGTAREVELRGEMLQLGYDEGAPACQEKVAG